MDRKSPLGDTTVQKVAVYSDTAPLSVVQRNQSGSRQAQRRSYFFYTDTSTASTTKEISDDYKFLFSFGNLYNSIKIKAWDHAHIKDHFGSKGTSGNSASKLSSILLPDVKKIIELFNQGLEDKSSGGKYQSILAKKALNLLDPSLGESLEEGVSLDEKSLLKKIYEFLSLENYGAFVIHRPDETQSNLDGLDMVDPEGPVTNLQADNYEYKTLKSYDFRFKTSDTLVISHFVFF